MVLLKNLGHQKTPHFRVFDPKMTQMRHQSKKLNFMGVTNASSHLNMRSETFKFWTITKITFK